MTVYDTVVLLVLGGFFLLLFWIEHTFDEEGERALEIGLRAGVRYTEIVIHCGIFGYDG